MKKIIAVLLAALLLLTMVACAAKSDPTPADTTTDSTQTPPADTKTEGTTTDTPAPATTEENAEDDSSVLSQIPIEPTDKKLDASTRIVCVVKGAVNPFWVEVIQGINEAGADLGIDVSAIAPVVSNNNEEQIQLIEQAIVEGCDALCIYPADSSGIEPAVEAANEAGIPVINANSRIFNSNIFDGGSLDVVTFVATENYDVAYQTAGTLAEMIGEQGNIVILEGPTGGQTSIDRVDGANARFDEYEGIQVIDSQTANDSRSEAMTVTQDLLQKHADITAIFAENGEMGLGAAEACIQAGRTDIKIALIDMNEEICTALNDGKIACANDGLAYNQGYYTVVAAYNYLAGDEIPDRIVISTKVVTKDNIAPYLEKFGIQ